MAEKSQTDPSAAGPAPDTYDQLEAEFYRLRNELDRRRLERVVNRGWGRMEKEIAAMKKELGGAYDQ